MTTARRSGLPAHLEHELRPVDPARERPSPKSAKPNQRRAIWHHQVGGIKDAFEGRIVLRLHDPVHAGECDIAATAPVLDPLADGSTCFRKVQRVHMHTQDFEGEPPYFHSVPQFTRQGRSSCRDSMARL